MIDFKKTFLLKTLTQLRGAKILVAWLNSAGAVFNSLYIDWVAWLKDRYYEISITPQVCYIEKMLNDEFDKQQRRIYISEPARLTTNFFYRETDGKNWYFGSGKFFVDDTRFNYPYDFIINLPSGIIINSERLNALVNRYKLLGKTYRLLWIQ